MSWDPSVGERIGNRYRLEEVIGRGGFTVVWKATDTKTGEYVAIKQPNYGAGKSYDAVEKYLNREVEALRTIERNESHPNIISLKETIDQQGTQFVVVDYVDGEELKEHGRMDQPNLVTEIGIQLCDVFSLLHDLEIIYRDLKPDNAMVTRSDDLVLIDFNTARMIPKCANCGQQIDFDNATEDVCPNPQCNTHLNRQTQVRAGRSKYKPPEVKNADGMQGPWSDVYSIGKILFFLLTGLVTAHPMDDPREREACPDYLADIIVRATALEPINRYRNAGVMKYCLEQRDADAHNQLPEATITNLQTNESLTIAPGDTIGRESPSGPFPTVSLEGGDTRYISRVHARFDFDGNDWVIVDKSSNGTVVGESGDWTGILQREAWDGQPDESPPRYTQLEDGDTIGVPRPNKGVQLEFST